MKQSSINKEKGSRLLRPDVLEDLRKEAEAHRGRSKKMQLYSMMRHLTDGSMGVSIDEIASTLYPNEYAEENQYDLHHTQTLELTRQLITAVNKWEKNNTHVVHAAYVVVEGYGKRWVYYNMVREDDPNYQKVLERREKVAAGIKASKEAEVAALKRKEENRKKNDETDYLFTLRNDDYFLNEEYDDETKRWNKFLNDTRDVR